MLPAEGRCWVWNAAAGYWRGHCAYSLSSFSALARSLPSFLAKCNSSRRMKLLVLDPIHTDTEILRYSSFFLPSSVQDIWSTVDSGGYIVPELHYLQKNTPCEMYIRFGSIGESESFPFPFLSPLLSSPSPFPFSRIHYESKQLTEQ